MRDSEAIITLYNARFDPEADDDVYDRTVITGVHWYNEVVANVGTSGLQAANKCTIRIPIEADFSGKSHAAPSDYADPETQFTFRAGDIIVLGNVPDINPRPKDLRKKYVDCVTLLGVTDMTNARSAPHWKVVGS